ncbi:hypothetical protein LOK49_LG08G00468 [Camellia lanceoleosa]|uniref:Uncharacterized protein n=1 Tax=Camellia lanceoleosa TaxID=1840588 RepID=A0ACC0GY20_9ERIC|nr:hypothetical protein LOK49_LG08G00468 [Camellia lanceoleosa]
MRQGAVGGRPLAVQGYTPFMTSNKDILATKLVHRNDTGKQAMLKFVLGLFVVSEPFSNSKHFFRCH